MLPVMGGVVLGQHLHALVAVPTAPYSLPACFCTALAPVQRPVRLGLTACWPVFLHASVVLCTSSPVAGMNLYNNGFSAGLVAIVLSALIPALRRPT